MKLKIKSILTVLGALTLIAAPIPWANAEELLFAPTIPCKKPPKSPPRKMLDRFFPDIEGDTDPAGYGVANRPFETNVDINGDGWCDWVSLGGSAPHMFGESPPMEHFLFLGTETGWRRFGTIKDPLQPLPPSRLEGPRVLPPKAIVSAFQDPLFVYSSQQSAPYVVVTRTTEDILTAVMSDVDIYRWNDDLDMLELLTLKARAPIILFLRDNACNNSSLIRARAELSSHQTLDAICKGRTEFCNSWNECLDGKTPLCDQHGNCDEYSVWEAPPPPEPVRPAAPRKKH